MTERLKNFYDQVGLDFENFQRVTVNKGDMEKFAELIVRECSTLAYDGPNGILEHFGLGVEERKSYKVTLLFDNLDNSLYTDHQTTMSVDIQSDNYHHAYLLAQRLTKVMEADRFDIDEKG